MAKLEAKIEADVSAVAQQALNEFARKMEKEHGVAIQSIHFEWTAQMDGRPILHGSEMNTWKIG